MGWRAYLIVVPLLAASCTAADNEFTVAGSATPTSASPVQNTSTTSSTVSTVTTQPESTTSSTPRRGDDCVTSGEEIALDRVWELDTELELLVDTRVTFGSAPPLRNARQITIRSGPVVDGAWQLTMIDRVGERVANYAHRLPIVNPVNTDFVVSVDYIVTPDGAVALKNRNDGTAINVSYADFVFDLFGPTDGELSLDPRFEAAWLDLVAAGGFEILDPSSAAARTLALLTNIHAHHGDTIVLGESVAYSGEWREVALAGPLAFDGIVVEASVARNGCVEIESVAEASDGTTGRRSLFVDPDTGVFLGSLSFGAIPSIEGDIGFSTSISTLESSVSD